MALLRVGRVVESPATRQTFEILGRLGDPGGYGEAYRARVWPRRGLAAEVCVKATEDSTSWHREAYFGELLHGHRRVIQLHDSFPVVRTVRGWRRPLYLLVFELAEHGTVASYLQRRGRPVPPGRAKQEIAALLRVLTLLHGGSATHRDLSPSNVLVGAGERLKLADFGIARHALLNKQASVSAANWWIAPPGFAGRPSDDAYMMGQLFAMLLAGEAWRRYRPAEVAQLPGDEETKAIIRRAIGPQKQRFADAWEMLEALEGRDRTGHNRRVRTLRNKTVAFTGPLRITRADAETLVLQAGGRVAGRVTKTLDVLVVGGRSPLYKKGHKGTKLAEADRLNDTGADIRKIGEGDFMRLVKLR